MKDKFAIPFTVSRFATSKEAVTMEVTKAFVGGSTRSFIGRVNTSSTAIYDVEDKDLLYVMLMCYEAFLNYGNR